MDHFIKPDSNISSPIVFLCGPKYYEKDYDRRYILKKYFYENPKLRRFIPLVVDYFLSKSSLDKAIPLYSDKISIPLIEEICAAVSVRTYFFLDSFSSVAELGIFANQSYKNSIVVFLPLKQDIVSNELGVFVNELLFATTNINYFTYRPKIIRVPKASDFVTEYYEFPQDKIPDGISNLLLDDTRKALLKYKIFFMEKTGSPEAVDQINYSFCEENKTITFSVSVIFLFYLIASIVYSIYEEQLYFINDALVNEIEHHVKNLLRYELQLQNQKHDILDWEVEVATKIEHKFETLALHILAFQSLYNNDKAYKGKKLLKSPESFISSNYSEKIKGLQSAGLNLYQYGVIKEYISNPNDFIKEITIKKGRKLRKLVTYRTNVNGETLREIHKLILDYVERRHVFSSSSYAYRCGFSIYDCVKTHKNGISFIKLDIKDFFGTININKLKNRLEVPPNVTRSLQDELIDCCSFDEKIPLGYITSPILSDVYLKSIDNLLLSKIKEYKDVTYTRYADDLIFSFMSRISVEKYVDIKKVASEALSTLGLKLNDEKSTFITLNYYGDHVKLLGLNIVKSKRSNKITIGKKYIFDTALMYLKFIEDVHNDIDSESKLYTEKRISGRIAFIKQIEGAQGFEKLRKRIFMSTKGEINIKSDRIDFSSLHLS